VHDPVYAVQAHEHALIRLKDVRGVVAEAEARQVNRRGALLGARSRGCDLIDAGKLGLAVELLDVGAAHSHALA